MILANPIAPHRNRTYSSEVNQYPLHGAYTTHLIVWVAHLMLESYFLDYLCTGRALFGFADLDSCICIR